MSRTTEHWCEKAYVKTIVKGQDYSIYHCRKCGAYFASNYNGPSSSLIAAHEDIDFAAYYDNFKSKDTRNLVDICDLLLRYATQGRLLDIGSGIGTFISILLDKSLSFEITACEINKGCIERLKNYPVQIADCPIEKFKAEKPFDAITSIHSLEHFANPFSVIRKCHAMLKPKGILLIQLPAHRSPLFWKGYITKGINETLRIHYNFGGHVYGFLPKTIRTLVVLNNFKVLYMRTGRYYQRYHFVVDGTPFIIKPFLYVLLKTVDFFSNILGVGGITLLCQKV
jgi:2-polyprenyl-3-methyl-5-hydroxy-6-metoxy-1,4-benzoquinol methylase